MNFNVINFLLVFILPPVMGAIIGYVTNHIAIKMLFRPLKEIRVFGIRVPFTPGIIPKQRENLAESIGNMVSRELITEETFHTQVVSSDFRERVGQSISGFTAGILQTRLATLTREKQQEMYSAVEKALAHFMKEFFDSPSFPSLVKRFLSGSLSYLLQRPLGDFIKQETIASWFTDRLYPFLAAGETRAWIEEHLKSWLKEKIDANLSLKALISDPVVDFLIKSIDSLYPHMLSSLLAWLRSPELKTDLKERGSLLLIDALNKLNVFQKFFVSLAQYDKTLEGKMPAIIDDALNHLEMSLNRIENKEALLNAARKAIYQWREKGLNEFLESSGAGVNAVSEYLLNFIFQLLGNDNLKQKLTSSLLGFWEKYEGRPLSTLLEETLALKQEAIVDYLFKALEGYLNGHYISRPDGTAVLANSIITSFSSYLEQQAEHETIQSLLVIRETHKAELDTFLLNFLINLVDKNVPQIVETLNVKQLVVNKINGLDILQVENLLLMVIAKQLKWIDIFGGILGFLLGLTQVAFNLAGVG